ncbi:MAG: HTH domain-containing protein, partial [Cellulosilyticum sp.]|nr:HTH domain-containing protein [Cellulosilyticum sp.]
MQLNRLFEIVYILLNRKQVTARELAQRFEVSTRTIYRDIESLTEAGVPVYTNKGKGGGISLLDNFILNKSYLNTNEQQEILTALQGLKVTAYTPQNQVIDKLSALFGSEEEEWITVDFGSWDTSEKEKFDLIKMGIL